MVVQNQRHISSSSRRDRKMKMPEKEENQLDKEGNGQGNVEEIMEKEKLYIKINIE